jgi:dienelactone hydrolase
MLCDWLTSSTLTVLFLAVVTALPVVGLAAAQTTDTVRIEIHSFDTVTLTDKQFLCGAQDGKPARIAGELRLPSATGRFPAVILIHGSAGIGANLSNWAQKLNGIGVAAFLLDSFTGRGIVQTITDQSQLGNLAMIVDAYRALGLLSNHPRVAASQIGVMGFSKGGFVALYSSMKRFQRMYAPANVEFAAYMPFYARCGTRFIDDEKLSDQPIRMFHGAADDWSPVQPCRDYVERLRRAARDVQLAVYPGAHHAFDNPLYQPVRHMPDAEVSTRCRLEERADGEIINLDTGQPFSRTDACVTRGATVGYDPNAHAEAVKAIREFLQSAWKLCL